MKMKRSQLYYTGPIVGESLGHRYPCLGELVMASHFVLEGSCTALAYVTGLEIFSGSSLLLGETSVEVVFLKKNLRMTDVYSIPVDKVFKYEGSVTVVPTFVDKKLPKKVVPTKTKEVKQPKAKFKKPTKSQLLEVAQLVLSMDRTYEYDLLRHVAWADAEKGNFDSWFNAEEGASVCTWPVRSTTDCMHFCMLAAALDDLP